MIGIERLKRLRDLEIERLEDSKIEINNPCTVANVARNSACRVSGNSLAARLSLMLLFGFAKKNARTGIAEASR